MTNEEAKEIMSKVTFYWELGEQTLTRNQIDEALDMAIKALEQQPCEDCISRQKAIDAIDALYLDGDSSISYLADAKGDTLIGKYQAITTLDDLSSVTPQTKTGKWERYVNDYIKCSKCGELVKSYHDYKYCPNCGRRMKYEDSTSAR